MDDNSRAWTSWAPCIAHRHMGLDSPLPIVVVVVKALWSLYVPAFWNLWVLLPKSFNSPSCLGLECFNSEEMPHNSWSIGGDGVGKGSPPLVSLPPPGYQLSSPIAVKKQIPIFKNAYFKNWLTYNKGIYSWHTMTFPHIVQEAVIRGNQWVYPVHQTSVIS